MKIFKKSFHLGNTQQDIRHHGKVVKDVLELVSKYNKYVKDLVVDMHNIIKKTI